jgi:hypothetical protein
MSVRTDLRSRAGLTIALLVLASTPVAEADGKSPFLAPDHQAMLVFIQNEPPDYIMEYTVYDRDKLCVAKVAGREAAMVAMSPGKHTLYIASFDNQRIDVDLAPGRTYFVRFAPVQRVATPTSGVTPVQRGTRSYELVKTWLDGARVIQANQNQCRGKPLKERAKRTQRRMDEANAEWNMSDERYRLQYSLVEEDGFAANELSWL